MVIDLSIVEVLKNGNRRETFFLTQHYHRPKKKKRNVLSNLKSTSVSGFSVVVMCQGVSV